MLMPLFSPVTFRASSFTDLNQCTGTISSGTNATTYSRSITYVTAAAAKRRIVALVTGADNSGSDDVVPDTVTIGGISATLVVSASDVARSASIWVADVPTGTSGTIQVDWSGTQNGCYVSAWGFTGDLQIDPANLTAEGYTDTATDANAETALKYNSLGGSIGFVVGSSGSSHTISNIDSGFQLNVSGSGHRSYHGYNNTSTSAAQAHASDDGDTTQAQAAACFV